MSDEETEIVPLPVGKLTPEQKAENYDENGRLKEGHQVGVATRFNSETSRIARERRREKMEAAVRKELRERGVSLWGADVKGPQDVFGKVAGDFLVQIVADKTVAPRDRRQTYETLVKMAGMGELQEGGIVGGGSNRLSMDLTDEGLRAVLEAIKASRA